ncbi:MAG TPA: VIT1/CCC1 transporter family protein [Anaerolineaceae bacterium]|nr:VIT1/CCC1 transporter family protein [Anaerolineaceae bacterium]
MGISKRLEEARKAYQSGDKTAAAKAHDARRIAMATEEHAGAGSEYIGSMIYGGLDGIITTFAVVSGVAGAQLDSSIILILGLANLLGDGFSMATGAYLSSKSEHELYERERQREAWEVEEFPEGEAQELYELYVKQGYPEDDARALLAIKTRDKERWVDAMMVEELGLMKSDLSPVREGVVTFISFVVAGVIPLLFYLLNLFFRFDLGEQSNFFLAIVLSGLALFGLGASKVFITQRSPIRGGLEMLIVGGLAAAVAYAVGALLKGLTGVSM